MRKGRPRSLRTNIEQPFRILPSVGAEHVIAEADGTMICTVAPGQTEGQTAAGMEGNTAGGRAGQGKARPFMPPPSGTLQKWDDGGAIARAEPAGD